MASNSAKSKSNPKPQKEAGTKVTVKKQTQTTSSAKKKTKAQIEKQLALKEAKAQVKALKSAVKQLQAQLKAERNVGLPDPSDLHGEASLIRTRLEKVQLDLAQAKSLSTKRKDEIDEWKTWYENLPDDNKPAGLISLQAEIAWRAAELDSNAQTINQLMQTELETMGGLVLAQQKLAAIEAGYHELPIDKDPRLKNTEKRLKDAQGKVARLTLKRAKN